MSPRKETTDPGFTREDIRGIATGFQQSRVVLTAFELGLFTAVGSGARTSAEVAADIGTNPRATDRLMNALCAIGLLAKEGGRYSNTAVARRSLVRGEPEYLAGLMHTAHLWETWSMLTAAVRKGTMVASERPERHGDDWRIAFIDAMHDRARTHALECVRQIGLAGVSSVLDVGGGSGAYAMAFVRAAEGIRATVLDLPEVIPLTRKFLEREGLANRVSTVAGDYLKDSLGRDFDVVFLSAIVHSNATDENRRLIKKCAAALRPRGRVVVQDFVMDEDRVHPPHGAFFALNMLVGTAAGDTFTESEIASWMTEAGLQPITRNDTRFGTTQIIGRKPG